MLPLLLHLLTSSPPVPLDVQQCSGFRSVPDVWSCACALLRSQLTHQCFMTCLLHYPEEHKFMEAAGNPFEAGLTNTFPRCLIEIFSQSLNAPSTQYGKSINLLVMLQLILPTQS
jgi:hypothetical protein